VPQADSPRVRLTVNGREFGRWGPHIVADPLVPPGVVIAVAPPERQENPRMAPLTPIFYTDPIVSDAAARQVDAYSSILATWLSAPPAPRPYTVTVLPAGAITSETVVSHVVTATSAKAAATTVACELEHDGRKRKAIVTRHATGPGRVETFTLEPRQGFDVQAA
jgi:ribosomal protein S28E/S33